MTTDNKTLPVFRFARYVNGVRMAEGVTIEKANNLPDAMRTAAKLATIGHGGDVPVLVHEPATLADVQPGGRVRLGDQRSDLVPGIVRCAKCSFQLHRTNLYLQSGTVGAGDSKTEPCPNGCGPLWPVTWETWAREGWAEAERLHLENAALAARQPVGEPVAVVGADFDLFWIGSGPIAPLVERNGLRPGSKLYARPAQAVDHEVTDAMVDKAWNRFEAALHADDGDTPEDRVLSETIDQRDRYHEMADELAGHIARIIGVDIGEHSSANCPWQNAIEAAEEYKPAQAVDLGQFRALAAFGEEFAFSAEKQPQSRVIYGQANRLLALIDSQAVGNG